MLASVVLYTTGRVSLSDREFLPTGQYPFVSMSVPQLPTIPSLIIGVFGLVLMWARWLTSVESIEQRLENIGNELEDKEFTVSGQRFIIKQVDDIIEENSAFYQGCKFFPFVRKLKGEVEITVRSGIASREYVWEEENIGIDFGAYLEDVCHEEYPRTEWLGMEWIQDNTTFTGKATEIRLRIDSLDVLRIIKVIKQIPSFEHYYFEKFPGDGRYRPPY